MSGSVDRGDLRRCEIPDEIQEFLRRPNEAVVAVVRPDGHPVSVATWYLWEDDHVVLSMATSRRRVRYLEANPAVSLTVLDHQDWERHVSLLGIVVSFETADGEAVIDRMCRHYRGEDYRGPRERVTARVAVTSFHAWRMRSGR